MTRPDWSAAPGDVLPGRSSDAVIAQLAAGLRPVRRLAAPAWRATWWLCLIVAGAAWLAMHADLGAIGARLNSASDMWLSVVGSVATTFAAGLAAAMLAMPDRSPRWALAPLAPLALWVAASGMGCLRVDVLAGVSPAGLRQSAEECLPFILTRSVLLGVPLGLLLWRARPMRPGLVAVMAGLASASASASLLWFDHPFDAGLVDLIVHAGAVALVVLACRALAWIFAA